MISMTTTSKLFLIVGMQFVLTYFNHVDVVQALACHLKCLNSLMQVVAFCLIKTHVLVDWNAGRSC